MRRSLILLATVAMLVGTLAAPAAADRDFSHGNLPHGITWINPVFDGPEAEVATGGWVGVWGAWGTATEAQTDHFIATAMVEIICDGAVRNVSLYELFPTVALFEALIEPVPAGTTTECTLRITFTEDHYDGWDWFLEGTILENTVTINGVPRGQFE